MATTYPRPALTDREPVLLPAVVAFVTAGAGVAAAFGAPLTDEQRTAVLALVVAAYGLISLIVAFIARRRVTPLTDPRDEDGHELVPAAAAPVSPPRLSSVRDVPAFPPGGTIGRGAPQYAAADDVHPGEHAGDCGVLVSAVGHRCALAGGHGNSLEHWNPYTGAVPEYDPPGRHATDRE